MDPMEEIRETFFIECEELLETLEAGLMQMEEGSEDGETVNAVFRAVHSIKGGAGAFGLDHLVNFAHKFENVLDLVRSQKLDTTPDVMAILLRSGDVLSDLVSLAQAGDDHETPAATELLAELIGLTGESPAPAPAQQSAPAGDEAWFSPAPLALDGPDAEEDATFAPMPLDLSEADEKRFQITFKPHPRLYELGSETTLLFRSLERLGNLTVTGETAGIPPLDALDLSASVLSFVAELETSEDRSAIEEVFEFVDTECDLAITELGEQPTEEEPAATAPANDEPAAMAPAPSGEEKQQPAKQASAPRATVRVDIDRVDRLVNLVGELVITQAGISQILDTRDQKQDANAANAIEEFKQLTRELQDSVMSLRTQPVKPLFQRMQRISREAAAAAEKTVRLKTFGEATEVDKTVIERLSDPLTHMIRNAIDHGLEGPKDREAKGKSAEGTVTLSAAHRSGRVVIEIADDGAGINRDRVRAKAIENGLITEDAKLTDAEIDSLLFAPGFSTAKEVTSLSGRGVGMDVVKRSIQALGGRISIQSVPGQGTTFTISLPLTLAVLDGMVVTVENHTVVVPLTAILETHQPSKDQISRVAGEGRVLSIRGNYVPVIDVGYLFNYREPIADLTGHVVLLIETEEGELAALAVDSIDDQRQVVIKGLEENYGRIAGVSAATILGDGSIALILDTDDLIERATGSHRHALSAVA